MCEHGLAQPVVAGTRVGGAPYRNLRDYTGTKLDMGADPRVVIDTRPTAMYKRCRWIKLANTNWYRVDESVAPAVVRGAGFLQTPPYIAAEPGACISSADVIRPGLI